MRNRIDISEKPNHQHYTACLQRKQEIDEYCLQVLIYTLVAGIIMVLMCLAGAELSVFSVLPSLIADEGSVAFALIEILEINVLMAAAVMGFTKYKFFNIIVFLFYVIMAFIPIFDHDSDAVLTAMVVIAGGGGIYYSFGAFGVKEDYEKLVDTEGYPNFSLSLAEHDEKMKQEENRDASRNVPNYSAVEDALGAVVSNLAMKSSDSMEMPEIMPVELPKAPEYHKKRYMPTSPKVSGFVRSEIKIR